MYLKKYDKYYLRILKHAKFPFMKLKGNAMGNKSQYSDEEKTLLVIAENIHEISFIVNYLNDSTFYVYANSPTFIKTKIPDYRYINYHMHNYFHNVYILKERMTAFLKRVKRASKDIEIKKAADLKLKIIDQYFQNHIKTRNEHTHLVRFIDKDISTLEFFESACGSELLNDRGLIKKEHVKMAFSEAKKSCLRFMKNSNISINDFVGQYFDFITELILDGSGLLKVHLRKYSYEENRKSEVKGSGLHSTYLGEDEDVRATHLTRSSN